MYRLISDDDGHWYVIPKDKEQEAICYFEKIYEYYEDMLEDEEEPEMPDWLDEISGSPTMVIFKSYEIEEL
jgi:hypothetical protein